jgi:hypothetical protein
MLQQCLQLVPQSQTMCMQTRRGLRLRHWTLRLGQLSWTCWCRWLQHTAGTPEYIASWFALKIGKPYVDFLLHVHRQRHCAPARAQPPDEAA